MLITIALTINCMRIDANSQIVGLPAISVRRFLLKNRFSEVSALTASEFFGLSENEGGRRRNQPPPKSNRTFEVSGRLGSYANRPESKALVEISLSSWMLGSVSPKILMLLPNETECWPKKNQ